MTKSGAVSCRSSVVKMVDPGSPCTAHSFQPPHVPLPSCPFAGGPDSSGLFTPGKIRESALQTGLMYVCVSVSFIEYCLVYRLTISTGYTIDRMPNKSRDGLTGQATDKNGGGHKCNHGGSSTGI